MGGGNDDTSATKFTSRVLEGLPVSGGWLSRGRGLVASKARGGQTRGMTGPDDIAVLRIELENIEPLIWRRVAVRRVATKKNPKQGTRLGLCEVCCLI